jgi:cell division protein FtsB
MDVPSPRRKSFGARGVILLALIIAMLFSSVYPLGRYFSLQREIGALELEEQRLDDSLESLQRQRALLLTDAEVERLARDRLGYVRPGEIPFAIADPRAAIDEPEPILPPDEAVPDRSSTFERWWRALQRVTRVP